MASGRDMSYTSASAEMGGEGQQRSYITPGGGQGHNTSYNSAGEFTGQAQQIRHADLIDQASRAQGQGNQGYLQQMKTDEYLNQRNNNHGQGTQGYLQQTGESVMHAAQGAVRGASNMAQGAAARAANIAHDAAGVVKHTLGMDSNTNTTTTDHTGIPTSYAAGNNYSGNPTANSGAYYAAPGTKPLTTPITHKERID